jgi:2-amino-4-hydroxy-6-hydroxymethyldihydropteridine diphosphokinase
MSVVYLSLGSNKGDRESILELSIKEINERIGKITKLSRKYETEPWGFISDNKFLNMAIEVQASLSPSEISNRVHQIEYDLGRRRDPHSTGYQDRVIDIDILMIDNIVSDEECLTLPHPRMHLREFVLQPLCEIAPDVVHPTLGVAIKDIKIKNIYERI